MFIMVHLVVWNGGEYYHRFNDVKDNTDFCCYILDTDDMVVERYTRKKLEELLTQNPSIKIANLKHVDGKIYSIYMPYNHSEFIEGDNYLLSWEQYHDRGSTAEMKLYKRGVGLVSTLYAPKLDGSENYSIMFDESSMEITLQVHPHKSSRVIKEFIGKIDDSYKVSNWK